MVDRCVVMDDCTLLLEMSVSLELQECVVDVDWSVIGRFTMLVSCDHMALHAIK